MLLKFKSPFYQLQGFLFNPNSCQKYCELVLKLWIKICLVCPYINWQLIFIWLFTGLFFFRCLMLKIVDEVLKSTFTAAIKIKSCPRIHTLRKSFWNATQISKLSLCEHEFLPLCTRPPCLSYLRTFN